MFPDKYIDLDPEGTPRLKVAVPAIVIRSAPGTTTNDRDYHGVINPLPCGFVGKWYSGEIDWVPIFEDDFDLFQDEVEAAKTDCDLIPVGADVSPPCEVLVGSWRFA